MKKINTKKLNQFMMSFGNSEQLKDMVNMAVNNFLSDETPNPRQIALLVDLQLLSDAA
jgi:hypothetical protein